MRQHNVYYVCVKFSVVRYGGPKVSLCTLASQVTICSHNTDNVLYGLYISTFNQVCNFYLSTDYSSLMMVSL